MRARAHHHAAAAGAVALVHAGDAVDDPGGREIRRRHQLDQFLDRAAAARAARSRQASTTSDRLCGGMLVAMPTAMPEEPFSSRFGTRDGSTVGSRSLPS